MYLDKLLKLVSFTLQKRGVCKLVNIEDNFLPLSYQCAWMWNMYRLPSIPWMPIPFSVTFTKRICGNPSLCSTLSIVSHLYTIHVINSIVDTDPIIAEFVQTLIYLHAKSFGYDF